MELMFEMMKNPFSNFWMLEKMHFIYNFMSDMSKNILWITILLFCDQWNLFEFWFLTHFVLRGKVLALSFVSIPHIKVSFAHRAVKKSFDLMMSLVLRRIKESYILETLILRRTIIVVRSFMYVFLRRTNIYYF